MAGAPLPLIKGDNSISENLIKGVERNVQRKWRFGKTWYSVKMGGCFVLLLPWIQSGYKIQLAITYN